MRKRLVTKLVRSRLEATTTAPCFRPSSTLLDLPVCVATAHSIQFRKPGYPPHRNWLLLTDLLTNRIAQINTNHYKHTQPTVWNGHATHFPIQFSRFRNCPAEAEVVGSNIARTTDLAKTRPRVSDLGLYLSGALTTFKPPGSWPTRDPRVPQTFVKRMNLCCHQHRCRRSRHGSILPRLPVH